jgi:hypothetical protein
MAGHFNGDKFRYYFVVVSRGDVESKFTTLLCNGEHQVFVKPLSDIHFILKVTKTNKRRRLRARKEYLKCVYPLLYCKAIESKSELDYYCNKIYCSY